MEDWKNIIINRTNILTYVFIYFIPYLPQIKN